MSDEKVYDPKAGDSSMGIELDGEKPVVVESSDQTYGLEVETGEVDVIGDGLEDGDDDGSGDEGDGSTSTEDGEEQGDGGAEAEAEAGEVVPADLGEPLPDLGEYKPERVEEFKKRYEREDGTLNLEALSREWWHSVKKDPSKPEGFGLNESTYKWLADKHGVSKADAKEIEKQLFAATKAEYIASKNAVNREFNAILKDVGGRDNYQAAVEWARQGGYDDAAKARYNKVMESNDIGAIRDAAESLVARWQRAGSPKLEPKQQSKAKGGGEKREVKKPVTAQAPAGSGDSGGFKDMDEYQKAFAEASKSANPEVEMAKLRERLRRSGWWRKQMGRR